MNWQTFSTTGFLVHKQSGIKLYLYGINPKSLKSNLPQLSEFIKKIKPTVTGLHMVQISITFQFIHYCRAIN